MDNVPILNCTREFDKKLNPAQRMCILLKNENSTDVNVTLTYEFVDAPANATVKDDSGTTKFGDDSPAGSVTFGLGVAAAGLFLAI